MIGDMGKYRPKNFDEVIGQKRVVERIRNQSRAGVWFSSQVLEGHWGSGKTTLARIMLKAMNCLQPDDRGNPCCVCPACRAVLAGSPDCKEIDAASNTGVDNVRSLIEWAGYRPVHLRNKVIVIDEAQQLSASAWNAMLKLIEEPPEYMKFIFCTTDFGKIPETIRSRCAHYQLAAIPEEDIAGQILKIAGIEGVEITGGAARLLAKQAHGAMRDGLRILREMSAADRRIDEKLVMELSPVGEEGPVVLMLRALLMASVPELLSAIDTVERSGRDFVSLMGGVISLCSDCVVRVTGADISGNASYIKAVDELVEGRKLQDFLEVSSVVIKIRDAMFLDPHKEHLIVTAAAAFHTESGLSLRVAALEERLNQGYVCQSPEKSADDTFSDRDDTVPFVEDRAMPEVEKTVSPVQHGLEESKKASEDWDEDDFFNLMEDEEDDASENTGSYAYENTYYADSVAAVVPEKTVESRNISERASVAEKAVINMISAEEALKIHYQNKRIRFEYLPDGLRVECEDFVLAKLFLAFAGKYGIPDIEVTTA